MEIQEELTNMPNLIEEEFEGLNQLTKFSLFAKPISNVHPTQEVDLKDVHEYLTSDTAKEATITLRELGNESDAKELKSTQFDYVTFGGIFGKRGEQNIKEKSGLLCLDIDDVNEISKARKEIRQLADYQPALLFTSPSGNGLKAVYRYNTEKGDHSKVYQEVANRIEEETGLPVDKAPKASSAACFLPYDPDAYLNLDAEQLQIAISESASNGSYSNIESSKDRAKVEKCVGYLEEEKVNIADEYEDWISLGFALANLGESGRKLYHRVSKLSPKYDYSDCDQQFTTCLESSRDEITLGTFYDHCKKYNVPLGEILQEFNDLKITLPPKDYWSDSNEEEQQQRIEKLLKSEDHPLVKKVEEKIGVPHEVLCDYNVGLGQIVTEIGSIEDALFVPYESGCTAYYFSEGRLIADHLKRSDNLDCYFGESKVIGQKKAIIAENPFDAMFLSCRDDFDVISTVDPIDNLLRENQLSLLQEQAQYWKKVYVFKRAVTGKERKEALKFVRKYADALPTYCEVYWINIAEQISREVQYVYEGTVQSFEKSIFETATYVWNTHTQKHRFWYIKDGSKPSLKIDEVTLANVLGKGGFKKTYIGNSTEPTLIKAKNNIVQEVSRYLLFDHVREDILQGLSKFVAIAEQGSGKLMSKKELVSTFFSYREKMLRSTFKTILNLDSLEFLRDGAKHSYLFYDNTAIKVTEDEVIEVPYGRLSGYIWEGQLLDREYYSDRDGGTSDFEQFLNNAAGDNPRKRKAFRTTLGYLLHTYKDKANTRAVILTDQHYQNDKAQGGTGKSIFAESIKHIRKQCYLAGKNIKVSDKFAFMDVELGDQNLFFDDVRPGFDFEGLFNVITNDMQVEAKYSNRVTIPFEDSPKIVIATNSVINGEGNSFRRRQRILEFSDHYLKNKSPKQEFGKRLYDDWDAEEWNRFDHFMIKCLQEYLSDGLVSYETVSYQKRKMIQKTSQTFIEWAENNLEANREYSTNVLFEGLDKQSNSTLPPKKLPKKSNGKEFDYYLNVGELGENQIKTFNRWIKTYCRYKGWELASHKTNGYDTIKFKK